MQPECDRVRPLSPAARLTLLGGGVLTAGLLAAAAFGCRNGPPPEPAAAEKPLAGVELRVACPDERAADVMRRHSGVWASRTGARVSVGVGPAATADVLVMPPAELGGHAEAGELLPVPESLTARGGEFHWDNLLPVWRDKLLAWGGRHYALPVLAESRLCAYRTDLLDDPKHQAAFAKKY